MEKNRRVKPGYIVLVAVMLVALLLGGVYLLLSRHLRTRDLWLQQAEATLRGQTGMDYNGIPLLPGWGEFTLPDENGRQQTVRYEGSDSVMVIENKTLDSALHFALAPSDVDITVTGEDGTEVFSGGLDELAGFVPPADGEFRYDVTVAYEEAEFSGSCGYRFLVAFDAPAVFALSSAEVRQGGVLLLTGGNLRSRDVLVTVPYSYTVNLVFDATGCVGLLPFNFVREPGDYAVTVQYAGETYTLPYTVTPDEYDIQHLTMPQQITNTTTGAPGAREEYNDTIFPLLESFDPARYWSGTFIRPVNGTITTEYGAQRITNGVPGAAHAGIDIATASGTPIVATNGAKVLYSGFLTVSGYTILLDHGMGLQTLHMHMSDVAVKTGEMVAQGDLIGYVGSTGYSTGPHLHFAMYIGGHAVNPWRAFDGTAGFYLLEKA